MEFRKPIYSLDYQFIPKDTKGCKSIARGRDIYGEVLNKGASVPVEFRVLQGGMWKSSDSPAWKLSEPLRFGFLWRLHYIGMSD